MKKIFAEYSHLWPEASHEALQPLLQDISFLTFPEDQELIRSPAMTPRKIIILIQKATIAEMIELLELGFSHCIQMDRSDFAQELLASCLMSERPQSFIKDPLPFFFTGFKDPQKHPFLERQMVLPLTRSSDKQYILNRLELFLIQNNRLSGLKDIAIQVGDELISNALFSAPVNYEGLPIYENEPRTSEVILPSNKRARFFAAFSDDLLVVGCEDLFGSIRKDLLMSHLSRVFRTGKATPRMQTAGAGLGFKYMIENSTNFYVYSERNKRTLVACGFLLENLRANRSAQKHIHLSCSQSVYGTRSLISFFAVRKMTGVLVVRSFSFIVAINSKPWASGSTTSRRIRSKASPSRDCKASSPLPAITK